MQGCGFTPTYWLLCRHTMLYFGRRRVAGRVVTTDGLVRLDAHPNGHCEHRHKR